MEDLAGRTFSHYRVINSLGSGGMGAVYKAEDTMLERIVALKFLPPSMVASPAIRARFVREARAASALEHSNICNVHAIEETEDGRMFIVMAYYEGETVKQRIALGPLAPIEAIEIAAQCADGLARAHERGIVHRDIKPGNLIRLSDGVVKILDFGVAKLADASSLPQRFVDSGEFEDDRSLGDTSPNAVTGPDGVIDPDDPTVTNMVMGTPAFMSPEQTRLGDLDHRTDIWSVGVTLYEMITGLRPFRGRTIKEVVRQIRHSDPEPLTTARPDAPAELERIVVKALAKRPEDRYQQIDTMLVDLRLLRQQLRSTGGGGENASLAPSIAVMPFANLSDEAEQEYFCDGMTDEIISALTRVEGLRVVARSSAFTFKGRNMGARDVGNSLRVGVVLEGSVRKAGNMLRIGVQLVDVASGSNLWSETYNRELKDVFAIQADIAEVIVGSQAVRQLGHEGHRAPAVRKHTRNLEAYNLYLKGRFHWNKRTVEELHTAIGYFGQAIVRDPAYSLAFAGLADCNTVIGYYGAEAPAAAFPKAKANAIRAIELDDTLAEAHTSLAFATLLYDWDWSSAEQSFKRALALNPDYSTAHHWYAEYLTFVGRVEEAVEIARKLLVLDPLSPIIITLVGWVHFYERDYDRAIETLESVLQLDRDFIPARLWLGLSHERKGNFQVATTVLQRAVEVEGDSPGVLSALGRVLASSGQSGETRRLLQRLQDRAAQTYVPAYHIAALHATLGETGEMLRCLEEAQRQRDLWLLFLRIDPVWDGVRNDPGFVEIVRQVGLP